MITKADNVNCTILLNRLRQYITLADACNYIGLNPVTLKYINRINSSSDYKKEDDRDELYHLKKIKHFIKTGIEDPIDIDCFCRDNKVYNWPVILDGRHRYIAAILRNDKIIPATFSGSELLMNYLTGKTSFKPRAQ